MTTANRHAHSRQVSSQPARNRQDGRPALGSAVSADIRLSRGSFTLDAALELAPGEVVAVLGPNGAGKTTLLRALAGLEPIEAGSIELAGRIVDGEGIFVPAEQRAVGVVFQDYRLFPHLRVLDNVAFGPRSLMVPRDQARERARNWLVRLDIGDLGARKPRELSGGQAQRVALARALATEPSLLLLDEPLAALDAHTHSEVRRELRRHLRSLPTASLVVTHDPLDALVLADRMLILESGRIVQQGTGAQVARFPASPYVARLMGVNLYGAGRLGSEELTGFEAGVGMLALIRPEHFAIARREPVGAELLRLQGEISGMEFLADHVRVWAEHGGISSMVDLSPARVSELALLEGDRVWLSVPLDAIVTYPRSGG